MYCFISARFTTASRNPCSRRNSLRWKPSGSFWRIVCSITRGPAKPINAPGSPMFRSPSMAKLAVTPPEVRIGQDADVRDFRLIQTRQSSRNLGELHQADGAFLHAQVRPEALKSITRGLRFSTDRSTARVIFSPTTAPMLPPMNFHSMAQIFTCRPSSEPEAESRASESWVFS